MVNGAARSAIDLGDVLKGGLREIDINVAGIRPATADEPSHAGMSFSSVNNVPQQPPLKRHATATEGSRLPMKLSGTRGKVVAEGRENVSVLSQSVGVGGTVGSGNSRRLRNSPPQ